MKNIRSILIFLAIFITSFVAYPQDKQLIILHTNDMHSQVEPLSEKIEGFKAGKGGMTRVYTYINEEMEKDGENIILLDAGDFSQGSVYYNLMHGEAEVSFMNTVRYDAATMGNHEFDSGMDNLVKLIKMANFPFVNCNYDLTNTPLNGLVKPYVIVNRASLKIGIFGLGPHDLRNVSFARNIEGIVFKDTFRSANETADKLRNEEKCDLVICLSHIGWTGTNTDGPNGIPVCDSTIAIMSSNIDVIIGGHTHTYMKDGKTLYNINNQPVYINQTSGNTATVGRMVIDLKKEE